MAGDFLALPCAHQAGIDMRHNGGDDDGVEARSWWDDSWYQHANFPVFCSVPLQMFADVCFLRGKGSELRPSSLEVLHLT